MIVIRSCEADGRSRGGFIWPLEVGAVVESPDWDPTPKCGKGLHGLRPGDNYPGKWHDGACMALNADEVIDLDGKCKFRRATILHVAPNMGALSQWLSANGHPGPWYKGTATAGDNGTASAGYCGTASAGDYGTASAGDWGTASAGDWGTASVGYCGTGTAGGCGTASAGYRGTAVAGDYGTASAGYRGTAAAGYRGTASAGYRGTAAAGESGVIIIRDANGVPHVGLIGENGLKPNTPYWLNDRGEFEEVPA